MNRAFRRSFVPLVAVLALSAGAAAYRAHAEAAHVVPPPMIDEPANGATTEVAVLAGGCFWGVQGVFQHVDGVASAVSGYAGGKQETAQYETVGTGRTGHAESVKVTFDPRRISYGHILQIYFSVAHDPTELNRQGPDVGTQYRSVIFPTIRSRRTLPRAISPSSTKHACLMLRSSQGSSPAGLSTRPRTITRTSWRVIQPIPTLSPTTCRRSRI